MEKKPIIELSKVSYSYDARPFLEDMNLKVFQKDFVGMIGPNGGGKTTLIKLILGLLKPDKGKIKIFGLPPEKGRLNIGYLSQFSNLDTDFPITVLDIVLMNTQIGLISWKNSSEYSRAKRAMEKVGLWNLRNRKLNELSGGEKQRVFIARALASEPKALILDEPVVNVDMKIRQDVYETLKQLNKSIAIILVDHNIEALSKYVKKVICINKCRFHGLEYHDLMKIGNKKIYEL